MKRTKRTILSFVLCLTLCLTAFLMAACGDKKAEDLHYTAFLNGFDGADGITLKIDDLRVKIDGDESEDDFEVFIDSLDYHLSVNDKGLLNGAMVLSLSYTEDGTTTAGDLTATIKDNRVFYKATSSDGEDLQGVLDFADILSGILDTAPSSYVGLLSEIRIPENVTATDFADTLAEKLGAFSDKFGKGLVNLFFDEQKSGKNFVFTFSHKKLAALNENLSSMNFRELTDHYFGEGTYARLGEKINGLLSMKMSEIPTKLASLGLYEEDLRTLLDSLGDALMGSDLYAMLFEDEPMASTSLSDLLGQTGMTEDFLGEIKTFLDGDKSVYETIASFLSEDASGAEEIKKTVDEYLDLLKNAFTLKLTAGRNGYLTGADLQLNIDDEDDGLHISGKVTVSSGGQVTPTDTGFLKDLEAIDARMDQLSLSDETEWKNVLTLSYQTEITVDGVTYYINDPWGYGTPVIAATRTILSPAGFARTGNHCGDWEELDLTVTETHESYYVYIVTPASVGIRDESVSQLYLCEEADRMFYVKENEHKAYLTDKNGNTVLTLPDDISEIDFFALFGDTAAPVVMGSYSRNDYAYYNAKNGEVTTEDHGHSFGDALFDPSNVGADVSLHCANCGANATAETVSISFGDDFCHLIVEYMLNVTGADGQKTEYTVQTTIENHSLGVPELPEGVNICEELGEESLEMICCMCEEPVSVEKTDGHFLITINGFCCEDMPGCCPSHYLRVQQCPCDQRLYISCPGLTEVESTPDRTVRYCGVCGLTITDETHEDTWFGEGGLMQHLYVTLPNLDGPEYEILLGE